MSAKHTPGPWLIVDGYSSDFAITSQTRIDDSMAFICEIDTLYTGKHGIEQEANSRLIAAAPELLAALQDAIETIEALSGKDNSCSPEIECGEYRALIARAIGSAA